MFLETDLIELEDDVSEDPEEIERDGGLGLGDEVLVGVVAWELNREMISWIGILRRGLGWVWERWFKDRCAAGFGPVWE